MGKKDLAMWMVFGLVTGLTGCTSYYKVSDPASGHTYYATNVKERWSTGAIRFEDERTKNTVTLQSSEVKEISEEEFHASITAQLTPQSQAPAQQGAPK